MRKTLVSKANPTIRTILSNMPPHGWLGKKFNIFVMEVPSTWKATSYYGEQIQSHYLEAPDFEGGFSHEGPKFGGQVVWQAPKPYEILVRITPLSKTYQIVVNESVMDSGAIAVATDALLEKDKGRAREAVAGMGNMAGIALAIAEAQARALTRQERGVVPKGIGKAAQLQREIENALARRNSPSHLRRSRRRM